MEHLVKGVRHAVSSESWYAAVSLALALPDHCGAIERPGKDDNKARYVDWVERYVSKYMRSEGPVQQFMSAADLYLLRCSFLHQGSFEVEPDKNPNEMFHILNHVGLLVSPDGLIPGRLMVTIAGRNTTAYNVGVADLCEWICKGVEEWLPNARRDEAMAARLSKLPRIMHISAIGEWTPL